MTLKPGAPGTRTAYADLAAAIMDPKNKLPEFKLGPNQPAILLYSWCLQSRKLLTEDELHVVQDCLHLLTNLMDDEVRTLYLEECSRLRRRDAMAQVDKKTEPESLVDPRD